MHELAGRLLRRWHDQSGPAPEQDREAIRASMADQATEVAACLENTAGHLDDEQRALVQCVARELPELADDLPAVYQHGDYSTRNWLWDRDHGHGLIDFAMSGNGIAVEEFVWLCTAGWATRPDLKAAYLAGYGRTLSDTDERTLRLLVTRLGVSYLSRHPRTRGAARHQQGRGWLRPAVYAVLLAADSHLGACSSRAGACDDCQPKSSGTMRSFCAIRARAFWSAVSSESRTMRRTARRCAGAARCTMPKPSSVSSARV